MPPVNPETVNHKTTLRQLTTRKTAPTPAVLTAPTNRHKTHKTLTL